MTRRKLTIGAGHALWTEQERSTARRLLLAENTLSEVDEKLGRARGSTYQMLRGEAEKTGNWDSFNELLAAAKKGQGRRRAEGAIGRVEPVHVVRTKRIEPGAGRAAEYSDPIARHVDRSAWAERQRAFAADLSLTASLMGDPLPGRSALDRKREGRA